MIKKQFKKRLLSMVLCGAMVLSLCPQTAIAKQTDHSAEASISLDGGSGTDAPQKATPSEIETETPDEENVSGESSAAYAAKELTAPTSADSASSETVTVTFDSNGGSPEFENQEVVIGEKLEKPNDPVRDGYIFVGWLWSPSSMWDFDDPVQQSMHFRATWQPLSLDAPSNITWNSHEVGTVLKTRSLTLFSSILPYQEDAVPLAIPLQSAEPEQAIHLQLKICSANILWELRLPV